MRVVLVHGRAAQWEIPELMQRDWESALRYGLERVGSTIPRKDIDVRYAFYGDLWRPDFKQPLPKIEGAPRRAQEFGLPGVSDISLWFDEHVGVGGALIDYLLRDLDDYYSDPEVRAGTNARLIDHLAGLKAGERAIVIGFSMGTLVAYDSLRADPKLPVAALLTIGSPLAMPSFLKRITATAPPGMDPPTPFPSQLKMWVNVWTRDDPGTAGHVQMASRYAPDSPDGPHVQDLETWGRPTGPNPAGAHNAMDYLSSRVFATALDGALRMLQAG
jgi:hypothetical protein